MHIRVDLVTPVYFVRGGTVLYRPAAKVSPSVIVDLILVVRLAVVHLLIVTKIILKVSAIWVICVCQVPVRPLNVAARFRKAPAPLAKFVAQEHRFARHPNAVNNTAVVFV